ncbi:MAG: oxidoreductase, partial [Acidimicrobiales bacterium]|nr:oxidoreductase [Acidimicrobiales bacterium]
MELGEAALTSMTTRYFTTDPVSDETLEQAFDYARHAP